jgi:hypothetical protein
MLTLEKKINKAKTADIRIVALDETYGWRDEIQEACGRIRTIYFFDASQVTCLCSPVPCYLLYPLFSEAENDISEEMSEKLREGDMENQESRYFECGGIDPIAEPENFSHHLDGGLRYYSPDGKKHREIMEAAEEYFRGNYPQSIVKYFLK